MNPFTWLIGAGFWTVYMGIGLVVCAYFIMLAMPGHYKIMKGEVKPDRAGDWNINGHWILASGFKLKMATIIFMCLFLWPIILVVFSIKWLVIFFFKSTSSFIFSVIMETAKKLPTIKITAQK